LRHAAMGGFSYQEAGTTEAAPEQASQGEAQSLALVAQTGPGLQGDPAHAVTGGVKLQHQHAQESLELVKEQGETSVRLAEDQAKQANSLAADQAQAAVELAQQQAQVAKSLAEEHRQATVAEGQDRLQRLAMLQSKRVTEETWRTSGPLPRAEIDAGRCSSGEKHEWKMEVLRLQGALHRAEETVWWNSVFCVVCLSFAVLVLIGVKLPRPVGKLFSGSNAGPAPICTSDFAPLSGGPDACRLANREPADGSESKTGHAPDSARSAGSVAPHYPKDMPDSARSASSLASYNLTDTSDSGQVAGGATTDGMAPILQGFPRSAEGAP